MNKQNMKIPNKNTTEDFNNENQDNVKGNQHSKNQDNENQDQSSDKKYNNDEKKSNSSEKFSPIFSISLPLKGANNYLPVIFFFSTVQMFFFTFICSI